jgi:ABC-type Zn uptake system ZnuABC Zn-binding protein ZnuA
VVDAGDGVEVLSDEDEADPHIWHDPIRAKTMVANLTEALAQADPDLAQEYRNRASAYVVELDRLDTEIARQLATLPSDKIVTNHDAFGYYVDRYGLDFVGAIIPSFDSTAELSVDDVRRIVALIQAEDVRAVFSESDLPPKTAEAIGREAGVAVVAGEDALYGDSLGPPGSGAETYLDMMRHNTEGIVEHLG